MRSQANTAKVREDHPTLMRLRGLEVLERVAASGKLNIAMGEKGLAEKVVTCQQNRRRGADTGCRNGQPRNALLPPTRTGSSSPPGRPAKGSWGRWPPSVCSTLPKGRPPGEAASGAARSAGGSLCRLGCLRRDPRRPRYRTAFAPRSIGPCFRSARGGSARSASSSTRPMPASPASAAADVSLERESITVCSTPRVFRPGL